jgi:hypothetical protein
MPPAEKTEKAPERLRRVRAKRGSIDKNTNQPRTADAIFKLTDSLARKAAKAGEVELIGDHDQPLAPDHDYGDQVMGKDPAPGTVPQPAESVPGGPHVERPQPHERMPTSPGHPEEPGLEPAVAAPKPKSAGTKTADGSDSDQGEPLDYSDWHKPELEEEVEKRSLVVRGTGADGNILADDLRKALVKDDKKK